MVTVVEGVVGEEDSRFVRRVVTLLDGVGISDYIGNRCLSVVYNEVDLATLKLGKIGVDEGEYLVEVYVTVEEYNRV